MPKYTHDIPATRAATFAETPGKETLTITAAYDDVGPQRIGVDHGGVTDDTKPQFMGQGKPGELVTLYDENNRVIGSERVSSEGFWVVELPQALPNGTHQITAKTESATSAAFAITIDPASEYALKITGVKAADNSGDYFGQGAVIPQLDLIIGGVSKPNEEVLIYDGETLIGRGYADHNGNFIITPDQPLTEGAHALTAKTASAAYGPFSFTIDLPAVTPETPLTLDSVYDNYGAEQGALKNGDTTDDKTLTLSGRGISGEQIYIFDNGSPLAFTFVQEDGTWHFTPQTALAAGEHRFTVQNEAEQVSNAFSVTITEQPVPPLMITSLYDDAGDKTGQVENGGSTDDRLPTLQGTGKPGAVIYIIDGRHNLGQATVENDGTWHFTPSAALDTGEHNLWVTYSLLQEPDEIFRVTIDATFKAPLMISNLLDDVGDTQGSVENGGSTDDKKPTLVGTGIPGAMVYVFDGVVYIGQTTVQNDGSWRFTPANPLMPGRHNLRVGYKLTGERSEIYEVIVTSSPEMPLIIDSASDNFGAEQGALHNGASTDDKTPTLQGKGEPGTRVYILDANHYLGSAIVQQDGSWHFTPAYTLEAGQHSFSAEDDLGRKSSLFTLTITEPPKAPLTLDSIYDNVGAEQGSLKNGDSTDDKTPTLQGRGEPGSRVYIADNGHYLGYTDVQQDGSWSFTPRWDLSPGEHTFTVWDDADRQAGEFKLILTGVPLSLDTLYDNAGPEQGVLKNGDSTDDRTPTLQGKGEPGSAVYLFDGQRYLGETRVNQDGSWSFTPRTELNTGSHQFTAQTAAGTTSEAVTITITQVPLLLESIYDNVGAEQGALKNGGSTDDKTPTLQGRGEPGSVIYIYDNGLYLGYARVYQTGHWSYTPGSELSPGQHSFTIKDTGGRESGAFAITLIGPEKAPLTLESIYDNVGAEQGALQNGASTDDKTPTLQGKGEPGSAVYVFDNGRYLGYTYVQQDGSWRFTPGYDLSAGEHSFTVQDDKGPAGDALTVTITEPPKAPLTLESIYDNVGAEQGALQNGASTDDKTPTLQGKGEPGSAVYVFDNGRYLGYTYVQQDGSWRFTPGYDLSAGEHSFTVQDDKGPAGDALTVTITEPPKAPLTLESIYDNVGAEQGALQNGASTDDKTPTLQGKGEPGSAVYVFDNGRYLGYTYVQQDGSWRFTPGYDLSAGEHSFTVQDDKGPAGDALTVTITEPPKAPLTLESIYDNVGAEQGSLQNGASTDDKTPTLQGRGEPGSAVYVFDNGRYLGYTYVQQDGSWRFTPGYDLSAGEHSFTVQDDKGPAGDALTVTITEPPKAPLTIDSAYDNVGAEQGSLQNGASTDDKTPTLQGRGEPGSAVYVFDNGRYLGGVYVEADGTWRYTAPGNLPAGEHRFTVSDTYSAAQGEAFVITITEPQPEPLVLEQVFDNAGRDQGVLISGASSDDTHPTLVGSGQPGAAVYIYDNGNYLGTTRVQSDGKWYYTPQSALALGEHTLTVSYAGNQQSIDFRLKVVDYVAEIELLGVRDNVGEQQGLLQSGATTDDRYAAFTGKAAPGKAVVLHMVDNEGDYRGIAVAFADENGNFSIKSDYPLPQGEHQYFLSTSLGGSDFISQVFTLTVESDDIVKPEISLAFTESDGIIDDNGTATDNRFSLHGNGEPLQTLKLYDGEKYLGSVTTSWTGGWSLNNLLLRNGEHHITVRDAYDNSSESYDLTVNGYLPPLNSLLLHADDLLLTDGVESETAQSAAQPVLALENADLQQHTQSGVNAATDALPLMEEAFAQHYSML
ncbi:Ig-like domain-containing protein [Candidatus Pantoea soli]|uniref:Ig-like domain repeat protein n=1 Tax=Candidatus Pantoea soli TaxID=3098669 RepID=A0A518XH06_9GAMM|nr:Ig-like domain-containing protein [Pantoea soli]QDY43366.1 Ig-like domain repeat protein [Pantoea soli]